MKVSYDVTVRKWAVIGDSGKAVHYENHEAAEKAFKSAKHLAVVYDLTTCKWSLKNKETGVCTPFSSQEEAIAAFEAAGGVL